MLKLVLGFNHCSSRNLKKNKDLVTNKYPRYNETELQCYVIYNIELKIKMIITSKKQ